MASFETNEHKGDSMVFHGNRLKKAFLAVLVLSSFLLHAEGEVVAQSEFAAESDLVNAPLSSSSSESATTTEKRVFVFLSGMSEHYQGMGLSYRETVNRGFYDVEFVHHTMPLFFYERIDKETVEIERFGEITFHTLAVSRAIQTRGTSLRWYALGGLGITHGEASFGELKYNIFPMATVKLGADFRYGFIDFGFNIPIPYVKHTVNEKVDEYVYKGEFTNHVFPDGRIGMGFSF